MKRSIVSVFAGVLSVACDGGTEPRSDGDGSTGEEVPPRAPPGDEAGPDQDDRADGQGRVLILVDGNADVPVRDALQSAGYDVELGPDYTNWLVEESPITEYDVVIYLDGWHFGGMDRESDQALAAFVEGGDGLIRTEWSLAGAGTNVYTDVYLPLRYTDEVFTGGTRWEVLDGAHPLTRALPAEFEVSGGYSSGKPLVDTTIVAQNADGIPLLSYRDGLAGTVVHINHDVGGTAGTIEPEVLQLFVNAVGFAMPAAAAP